MAATYGPTWAQTTAAGGLGAVAGLSPAERMDEAMLQKQKQEQNALALATTRLQQQRTGQLLEQEELNLRKLRDLEAYRTGANVSGGSATVANAPGGINYTGSVVSGTRAPAFDPAAVQAGADYTQSNYQAAAFGGTPPAVITSDAAPAASAAKQPPPMRDAAKLVKDLEPVWANLEGRFGLPKGYLRRTAELESSLDPNAQNPNSSAGGLFQFIDGTAAEFNLENRFDPIQASNAAAKLASRNARILAGVLGRQPTAGELYLAHQQGPGGASVLLNPANQDKKAVDVVSDPQFVLLNGGDENMSVAKFVKKWGREQWAGSQYTYEQMQALNRGEGPEALKGNVYSSEKGLGLSIDREFAEELDRNLATGKMDFSFPSPAIAQEAAMLYPSGEEVLAAAEKTGARPGPRAPRVPRYLPAGPAGDGFVPVMLNAGTTGMSAFDYNPRTGEVRPRGTNAELMFSGSETAQANIKQRIVTQYALDGEVSNYQDAEKNVNRLTELVAGLKTQVDNAGPEEYAAKLEQYTNTIAELEAAKIQLGYTNMDIPGQFRSGRNVFSGEGPEVGITPEVEKANLKKLQDAEAKILETEKAAAAAFNAANSALAQNAPTSPEGKTAINTAIRKLQAGLNTTGTGDANGTVKPQASVYSLDPAKLATATQALEVAAATRATLVRQQALHRMAGNIDKEMQVELKIQELDANVISTNNYLKGMGVIRELKGGDLMPFVNLMANTFKTNDVELRETDGKWTLFVNGQENPTVKSMTQNDIAEYVGYLFDEDYKAATQAVSKSTVEFQRELLKKSHEAALKYTGEANNAASESARQAVIERIKNSGKFTQMGDSSRFQYTNEQGQIRIMDTEVVNPIDPDGLPSTVIYRIEGTGLVPVDS